MLTIMCIRVISVSCLPLFISMVTKYYKMGTNLSIIILNLLSSSPNKSYLLISSSLPLSSSSLSSFNCKHVNLSHYHGNNHTSPLVYSQMYLVAIVITPITLNHLNNLLACTCDNFLNFFFFLPNCAREYCLMIDSACEYWLVG